jgi:hypothetical protein
MTVAERLETLCGNTAGNLPHEPLNSIIAESVVALIKKDRDTTTGADIAAHVATTVARYAPVGGCRVVLQLPGLPAVNSAAVNVQRRANLNRSSARELLSLNGNVIGTLALDDVPVELLEARFAEQVAAAVADIVDRHLSREADRARSIGVAVIELVDLLPAAFTVERITSVIERLVDLPGVAGATLDISCPAELPGFDGHNADTFSVERGAGGTTTADHQYRCGPTTLTLTLGHTGPLLGEQLTAIDAVTDALQAAVDSVAGSIERRDSAEVDPETGLWGLARFERELETLSRTTTRVEGSYVLALFDTPDGTEGVRTRTALAAQFLTGDIAGRWSDRQLCLARRDVSVEAFRDDIVTMLHAASLPDTDGSVPSVSVAVTGTTVRLGDHRTLMRAAQRLLDRCANGDINVDTGS